VWCLLLFFASISRLQLRSRHESFHGHDLLRTTRSRFPRKTNTQRIPENIEKSEEMEYYSPALSVNSDMTDEELDKYFATYVPLSNLPTPPPAKEHAIPTTTSTSSHIQTSTFSPETEGMFVSSFISCIPSIPPSSSSFVSEMLEVTRRPDLLSSRPFPCMNNGARPTSFPAQHQHRSFRPHAKGSTMLLVPVDPPSIPCKLLFWLPPANKQRFGSKAVN
jgi:hypothetical protein